MGAFINEISLEGQYSTINEFEKGLNELRSIINKIKDIEVSSDVSKISLLSAIKNEFFDQSFNQISDISVKRAFNNIYYNKANVKNWREDQIIDIAEYFFWKEGKNENVKNSSVAELAQRKINVIFKPYLLINFRGSRFSKHLTIKIEKSSTREIVEVHCCDDNASFLNWLSTNYKEFNYDNDPGKAPNDNQTLLRDHTRFEKLTHVNRVNGRILFREKTTNQIWYVDSNHKGNQDPHLEVFSSDGKKYIGESDLEGTKITPPSKSQKNRKISIK